MVCAGTSSLMVVGGARPGAVGFFLHGEGQLFQSYLNLEDYVFLQRYSLVVVKASHIF